MAIAIGLTAYDAMPGSNEVGMIIEEVIHQHAAEAAFLWLLRQNALQSAHYTLLDLAKIDNRIDGHIDGLRIAHLDDFGILLNLQSSGEAFVSAVLAFGEPDKNKMKDLLALIPTSSELADGIISALGWSAFSKVREVIQQLLISESPHIQHIGIAGIVAHRQSPGAALTNILTNNNDHRKARGLRLIGELGLMDLLPAAKAHFSSNEMGCRFSAAWSAALLGDLSALCVLRMLAQQPFLRSREAMSMTLRRMNSREALAWQRELGTKSETQRLGVIGAGVVGDPVLIPWLIEEMSVPEMARVAGEAFTMITGVDLAYEDLDGDKPENFEAGPTEDPEDENVDLDPDENLPWPNAELIQRWWATHRSEFQTGVRHLLGKPITEAWMWQVLKIGKQRQRAAAAIELAILHPGRPLFNVKAPAFRQMELLAAMKTS